MVRLVHISGQNAAKSLRVTGIGASRLEQPYPDFPEIDRVVWCFPILPSYSLTYSWARELKRWGRTSLCAVTLTVPDDELVLVNHYSRAPVQLPASLAAGVIFDAADPRGYQIAVPRRIPPKDVVKVADLPRAVGWRYWPQSKNLEMQLCDCAVCSPRGEVKSRRYRARVKEAMERAGIPSTNSPEAF